MSTAGVSAAQNAPDQGSSDNITAKILEIQQTATEVKTIHGEAGVRMFNLTRESAGTSAASGEKVTRRAQ